MIKYKAELAQTFYKIFKKTKAHIFILDTKLQIDKNYKLKIRYKGFKSFQTLVTIK